MFKKIRQQREINKRYREKVKERQDKFGNVFEETRKFSSISIDTENKLWKIKGMNIIFVSDDLVNYELIQDDQLVTSGGFGLGRAIVGGALAGGVGAVIGGVTKEKTTNEVVSEMYVEINYVFNEREMTFKVPFINSKTKVNSKEYREEIKQAEALLSSLDELVEG